MIKKKDNLVELKEKWSESFEVPAGYQGEQILIYENESIKEEGENPYVRVVCNLYGERLVNFYGKPEIDLSKDQASFIDPVGLVTILVYKKDGSFKIDKYMTNYDHNDCKKDNFQLFWKQICVGKTITKLPLMYACYQEALEKAYEKFKAEDPYSIFFGKI